MDETILWIARPVLLTMVVMAYAVQVFAAGAHWTRLGLTAPDWIVGAHGDTVMAVSRDTLFVTTNGGYSWEFRSSPENKFGAHSACRNNLRVVYGVGWKRLGNGAIIASRLYRSSDAGTTWKLQCDLVPLVGEQEEFSITVSWAHENVMFANTRNGTLLGCVRSDDGGKTWRPFGDFNIGPHWFQLLYAQNLQDSKLFVAIGADNAPVPNQALYYSSDDGNTWEGGWPLPNADVPSQIVSGYPSRGDVFVVFTDSAYRALWHTNNFGQSWENAGQTMSSGQDIGNLSRVCAAPGNHGALFASIGYRSDPEHSRLLALYDDSTVWVDMPWIDSLIPVGLYWDGSRSTLYTSTDSGVFRLDFPLAVADNDSVVIPGRSDMGAPYPNPCSSTTSINVHRSTGERTTLRVYDALGREIPELRRVISWATQLIELDLRYLESGMYCAALESDHSTESRAVFKVK
jgi:photosystem II stability/assembly factor-like uncharacterized protein